MYRKEQQGYYRKRRMSWVMHDTCSTHWRDHPSLKVGVYIYPNLTQEQQSEQSLANEEKGHMQAPLYTLIPKL